MDITLFDPAEIRQNLLPFTFTRPVADVRVGILKISEKWEHYGFKVGYATEVYLSAKFINNGAQLTINGALCPNQSVVEKIKSLKSGQKLMADGQELAQLGEGSDEVGLTD